MPNGPIISVVIPAYNAEATIRDTLRSVVAQTFQAFEIIVVNDGSTDRTAEMVQTVADPRVRLMNCDNSGVAVARNRGIAATSGEFVSFMDADDLWAPKKLEQQLAALQKDAEAGAAYSWTAFVDERGKFLFAKEQTQFDGTVYEHLLIYNFVASGSNVLLRRSCLEAVGGFDPAIRGGMDDWDFLIRFSRQWRFVLVREYHILYRFAATSLTANVERTEAGLSDVIDRHFSSAPPDLRGRKDASMAWNKQYAAFLFLVRSTEIDARAQAARRLREAVRLHPPMLFERKLQRTALACFILMFVPRRSRRNVVHALMRMYGRMAARIRR